MDLFKYPLAIGHLLAYLIVNSDIKNHIDSDVAMMNQRYKKSKGLLYYLVATKPYRNLFYYRIGKLQKILKLFLPAYPLFYIEAKSIGKGAFVLNHPYATIINAKSIGDNFTVCHLTTIGNAKHGRNDLVPTIGDNVSLGANVTIIGDITIGNNVIIGAGSVVVKDVPNNVVVAGNPAKVIRQI